MDILETTTGPIAYDTRGHGSPIVLLASGAHDHHDFDGLRALLPDRFRTIAPDWPAHGESPTASVPASAMQFADVAEEFVAAVAPGGAIVVGNSVGGFAAARLAIRRPELVKGLVLVDSGGFGDNAWYERLFCALMARPAFLRRIYPAFSARYMRARTPADTHARERAIATTRRADGLSTVTGLWRSFAADEHDLRADAARITAPTLVLWGRHDPVIPVRIAHRIARTIPDARVVEMDTGHVPHTSDPAAVAAALVPFADAALARTAHHYRSPQLGEPVRVTVSQGEIDAYVRGDGPPIVFAHGWLANANLWRGVVDRLADRFRCVVLDLPFGSHRVPMRPDARLAAADCGALVADAIDALGLSDVTLVGNDSGGAYAQIALAGRRTEAVTRLVLTSCETPYDDFPPAPFDGLPAAAADPAVLGRVLGALEDPSVRTRPGAYGRLAKRAIDPAVSDSYALPGLRDPAVLRDVAKVMAGASTEAVATAGARLISDRTVPTLLVWSREDTVFPIAHARRYASALPDAELVEIDDAFSFTPEDQPAALADAITAFVTTRAAVRRVSQAQGHS